MAGTPIASYFVCATERSGSTVLCEALAQTGVAGRPDEYFEALRGTDVPRQPPEFFTGVLTPRLEALLPETSPDPAPELARARTYAEYLAGVRERGTTENGVFGAKLMWGYLDHFLGRLRELDDVPADVGERALLEAVFPDARYVNVVRRNLAEQAVSLWKAIQTQSWRAGDREKIREPVYDREAIAHLARRFEAHQQAWKAWFAKQRVEPLTLVYEEVVEDFPGAVGAVLEFIGVELPEGTTVEPPLPKQADELSRSWVERYERERSAATV